MARGRFFPSILLLLLLVIATGEMMGTTMVADAVGCSAMSRKYRGPCIFSSNCARICKTEHFTGGHCRFFRRSCVCTKPC